MKLGGAGECDTTPAAFASVSCSSDIEIGLQVRVGDLGFGLSRAPAAQSWPARPPASWALTPSESSKGFSSAARPPARPPGACALSRFASRTGSMSVGMHETSASVNHAGFVRRHVLKSECSVQSWRAAAGPVTAVAPVSRQGRYQVSDGPSTASGCDVPCHSSRHSPVAPTSHAARSGCAVAVSKSASHTSACVAEKSDTRLTPPIAARASLLHALALAWRVHPAGPRILNGARASSVPAVRCMLCKCCTLR